MLVVLIGSSFWSSMATNELQKLSPIRTSVSPIASSLIVLATDAARSLTASSSTTRVRASYVARSSVTVPVMDAESVALPMEK